MARGKKNLSLEERLAQINTQIEEYTEKIKNLKDEKKQVEQEIKDRDIKELYDAVQASGKSVADVKAMLG